MSKNAFTLVELLVVIGIISILAAMLLPVLQKAQQSAYIASCLSNAKQLGAAISQYRGDNREAYPYTTKECEPWVDGPDSKGCSGLDNGNARLPGSAESSGGGNMWAQCQWCPHALKGYIGDERAMCCPLRFRYDWGKGYRSPRFGDRVFCSAMYFSRSHYGANPGGLEKIQKFSSKKDFMDVGTGGANWGAALSSCNTRAVQSWGWNSKLRHFNTRHGSNLDDIVTPTNHLMWDMSAKTWVGPGLLRPIE
ncbi:MAG: type II secretion system GspH family protein [Planctomycetota bacterium]|nr:type II secretion system GspH family protein [Planctomycetota bacterium]